MKKLLLVLVLVLAGCDKGELVYKRGDIVRLKSGGCNMTVVHDTYNTSGVTVEWHDILGKPHRDSYYHGQIERVEK